MTKFFKMVCVAFIFIIFFKVAYSFYFVGNPGLATVSHIRINIIFQLIRRRYFPDELPPSNPWSASPMRRSFSSSDDITSSEDQFGNLARYSLLFVLYDFDSFCLHDYESSCLWISLLNGYPHAHTYSLLEEETRIILDRVWRKNMQNRIIQNGCHLFTT